MQTPCCPCSARAVGAGGKWLTANGFSAVLACRLAPGAPSGVVNYLAGLAGIGSRAFYAAVALGALPKTIACVALGGAPADPLSARGVLALALYVAAAAGGALVARRPVRTRPDHPGVPGVNAQLQERDD